MRVLVAPMMAMAESSGPASRPRVLASAMVSRGWQVTLCIPEGFCVAIPDGVSAQPVRLPLPLGMPPEVPEVNRDAVVAYLGNGTITPRRACAVLAEALRDSGLELYVAGLPEGFAKGVRTAPHFDFAELLPRAAVFVNHGGQNSVMDGIAYGTPQLICPGKVFERRFNAEAATRNGVGMSLEYGRFDVGAVRDAIGRLVDGRKGFQEAVSVLRSELAVLGGATRVREVMESRVG